MHWDSIRGKLHDAFTDVLHFLFPVACPICGCSQVLHPSTFCRMCESEMQFEFRRCLRCSAPIPDVVPSEKRCYHCRKEKWAFRRAYCLGIYENALQRALILMKKQSYEFLAIQMAERGGQWFLKQDHQKYDVVVSTPQHWWKRILRRSNTSEVLAETTGRLLEVPFRRTWLRCRIPTLKQGTLRHAERRANVHRAFQATPWSQFSGKRVLIADDILTSGSTASEIAKSIRAAGALHVDIFALARGVGRHSSVAKK